MILLVKVVPYLNFQHSLETLAFYEKLGATDIQIVKASEPSFADSPMAGEANPDFVMNAQFNMLGERIYCSDTWGNMPIDMSGQNISIVFDLNNEDEVNAVKELEAKAKELGCTITLPLGKTEWTELFGMFDDPFGVTWVLNGE